MPQQQPRLLRVEERYVIAATLERVRAHDPSGDRRLVEAPVQNEVVEEVRRELVDAKRAPAPFGMAVLATRPHGGWIRHLLDEEGAAGLLRILAHHVEAHAPAHGGGAVPILQI